MAKKKTINFQSLIKNKLVIITEGSYPYGNAATNRHLAYLKGLVELGANIELLIIVGSKEQSALSNVREGNFNGIHYKYLTNQLKPFSNIFKRILFVLIAYLKSMIIIFRSKSNNKFILLYSNPILLFFSVIILNNKGLECYHERTEYPFLGANKLMLNFYLSYVIPKFNGLFVITKSLKKYFADYINPTKILIVPMIVEPDRFKIEDCEKKKNIAYCGSMYTDKDGLITLIRAFCIIAKRFPEYRLMLIGDISNKTKFSLIQNEIENCGFKDRISCTGWKERNEIPILLNTAEVLALARPFNLQAEGGFPTKLGEYLSTGNPVVITAAGEIPNYLKDRYTAFISNKDDPKSFSLKLEEALSNKELAYQVGMNGRHLVDSVFNYKVQAMRIQKFLYRN